MGEQIEGQLHLLQDGERATFLGMSDTLRDRIMLEALNYGQIKKIHLDTVEGFFYSIALVNRAIYEGYWHYRVPSTKHRLKMATEHSRSNFSNPAPLRRLLRKTFCCPHGTGYTPNEKFKPIDIVFEFKLQAVISLKSIRIYVLPLVMETSLLSRQALVTTRVHASKDGIMAEKTIFQRQLRLGVLETLESYVYSYADEYSAQTCVNGLGDVVETHSELCSCASDVERLADHPCQSQKLLLSLQRHSRR